MTSSVWPVAGMMRSIVSPQRVQTDVSSPVCVQVGLLTRVNVPISWPSAGMTSCATMTSPQVAQCDPSVSPSLSQPGATPRSVTGTCGRMSIVTSSMRSWPFSSR